MLDLKSLQTACSI